MITTPDPDDDTIGNNLEREADAANAEEPAIPWEEIGNLEAEAERAAEAGALTSEGISALLDRAKKLVPTGRADIVSSLEDDLRALLTA
jgi:hypothetical protein